MADQQEQKTGFFGRLKGALSRTREGLASGLASLFGADKKIDTDLLDDIETALLSADVGIDATDRIVADLTARLKRRELGDVNAVLEALKSNMLEILAPVIMPLVPENPAGGPFVILMVGVTHQVAVDAALPSTGEKECTRAPSHAHRERAAPPRARLGPLQRAVMVVVSRPPGARGVAIAAGVK